MMMMMLLLLLPIQCTCWLHNLPMLLLLLLLQLPAPMLLLPAGTIAATALYNSCGSSFISESYNITSASTVTQAAVCICTV
jgi:hypothetical protein